MHPSPDLQTAVDAAAVFAAAATAELVDDELSAWNAFEAFCSSAGHTSCPAEPGVVGLWLSELPSGAPFDVTVDAISAVHLQHGFVDPVGELA